MQTRTLAIALLLAVALLASCNKKNSAQPKPTDAVEQKLQELAGSSATNCGRVKSIGQTDAKPASDCALQAAQGKKPFYVAYDLPGLTVAVAGSSDGKLFAVQSQTPPPDANPGSQPATSAQISVTPCPSELRVASSGRVTCYAAGSFGTGTGMNPHGGGMPMPPPGTANPHGGDMMMMPPPGTPNPHRTSTMPSSHGSATKGDKAASKDASNQ